MQLSVIVPVYNEAKTIKMNMEYLVSELQRLEHIFEIIVIDDGSTDDTFYKVDQLRNERFIVITKPKNEGKGRAFVSAYRRATYEYIALMDSDLQISPRELNTFFKIMHIYGADVVIGNKRHAYRNIHYALSRQLVSSGYNLMCRILFGISLRDTQCGLKLFKKSALDKVIDKILVKRFAFDIELIVALRENNIRIADAPVAVLKQSNRGSVNWSNIWQTAKDTLAVWYRKNKGWYKNET